jgi:hypothetical protein
MFNHFEAQDLIEGPELISKRAKPAQVTDAKYDTRHSNRVCATLRASELVLCKGQRDNMVTFATSHESKTTVTSACVKRTHRSWPQVTAREYPAVDHAWISVEHGGAPAKRAD